MVVKVNGLTPSNPTNNRIDATSKDSSIATVQWNDADGGYDVHLLKAGSTEIDWKSEDGGASKVQHITVTAPPATAKPKPGDTAVASSTSVEAVPDANSTIAQIKAYLDKKGISYPSTATKPDLVKLIPTK